MLVRPSNSELPDSSRPTLKQRLAQRRKAEQKQRDRLVFTILTVFLAALAGYGVGLFLGNFKAGVVTLLGILCLTFSWKYPRTGLWAMLLYLPFGGTISYVLGSNPLLHLAKDAFYIPALLGVVQYCWREKLPLLIPRRLILPLALLLGCCLLTLLLVNLPQQLTAVAGDRPLLVGLLGLKVLVGYIPLILCAYYLIRDRQDMMFLMRLTVVLILTCCGLALVQYLLLRTGICPGTTGYAPEVTARCFVGGSLLYTPQYGQIRLPGTFVAPWQWGWFLISAGFLSFAPAFNDSKPLWRTLSLLSLAAVVVLAVLSGQRIALVLVPVTVTFLLVMTGQVIYLKRFIPTAIALSLILGMVALYNPDVIQHRLGSLVDRWNASPPPEFVVNQFRQAIDALNGPLGNGLGRATNSARILGETRLIETYYPKLIYELGPLGAIAFLLVATSLTLLTWRAYRSTQNTTLRPYAAALWLFVAFISFNTYYYPLDVDPVAVYFWFFAGVVLKLPEIDRQERKEGTADPPKRRMRLKRRMKTELELQGQVQS